MIYNFNPGPAMLPPEVLRQAHEEFLDWRGLGASVMEISHRGPDFAALIAEIEQDLRDLLKLPDHYRVLFLSGGARAQFAAVPLNLAQANAHAGYVVTGIWGKIASEEARRYSQVCLIASNESTGYTTIPEIEQWSDFSECCYLHYTENETVHGVEFPFVPDSGQIPLICDMSSSILSRPLDVSKFALIYAGAQKNLGIAGITLVIVRDDLIARAAQPITPSVLNYAIQVKSNSMYNTPATFAWYISGLVFKWLKKQGGPLAMGERNQRKAQKLYQYIDQSDFYKNSVDKSFRSRMNVIFNLHDGKLTDLFLKKARQ
ncbi:MAG: 3-phosphoserine/phosphohydroxythreonine transaminase, partial [Proteobacteria bacterium]|nr:3-phosphoserine/phosphohydroxythreonine transaminase [Pseudomonadota bacterium]